MMNFSSRQSPGGGDIRLIGVGTASRRLSVETVEFDPHLSQMSTQWTIVFAAHSGDSDEAKLAIARLMCRYAGAVHRYFLKALKNPDAADELDQEFAVRFLRGDFKNSNPDRGRFRDYVKRAVQNLIVDYHRRKRPSIPLDTHAHDPAAPEPIMADFEQQFIDSWRKDLLDRAWGALESHEKTTGQPYHTILRTKVSQPDLTSEKLAQQLSTTLKKSYSPGAIRQTLQRSREKYVRYLLDEVRASLHNPSRAELEQELIDLNLLNYCRPFMSRQEREQKG
jgi:RNA polymerase sigma factor (sigma-70 family)